MSSGEEVYDEVPSEARQYDNYAQDVEEYDEAGPSRKRSRTERTPPALGIEPSIFGIAPRNQVTKQIGDFIMDKARGRENIEIEIKLGTLTSATPIGQQPKRIKLPSMSETLIPSDYPIGGFVSNMTQKQHVTLNGLLNTQVEARAKTQHPIPIHYARIRHIDNFYPHPGSAKIRVSTDMNGNVVEGGSIKKRRIADLNVHSPNEQFDWRVSISTEEPTPIPDGRPEFSREKDRLCYTHQLCQVDLTAVKTREDIKGRGSMSSYELEIELLDVPRLIEEGEKEKMGVENHFDEILQSCLDTVRMLIRNV